VGQVKNMVGGCFRLLSPPPPPERLFLFSLTNVVLDILPGFIDAHAHWIGAWASEYKVKNSWEFYVNLAFGVTTLHNPSADTISIFRDAEYVRAGSKVGPRIFSTGQIIYGAGSEVHCDISSVDDAKEFLTQLKRLGAWSAKSYNQPCRAARQKVLTAARELSTLHSSCFPYHYPTYTIYQRNACCPRRRHGLLVESEPNH
jgi:hypothetical protein